MTETAAERAKMGGLVDKFLRERSDDILDVRAAIGKAEAAARHEVYAGKVSKRAAAMSGKGRKGGGNKGGGKGGKGGGPKGGVSKDRKGGMRKEGGKGGKGGAKGGKGGGKQRRK